jgi:hypothetical protein
MSRTNVYAEELTGEVALTAATPSTGPGGYAGIRFILASPPELHHTAHDDDRSCVTLWAALNPEGPAIGRLGLAAMLEHAAALLREDVAEDARLAGIIEPDHKMAEAPPAPEPPPEAFVPGRKPPGLPDTGVVR